jgi:hypothetical protein
MRYEQGQELIPSSRRDFNCGDDCELGHVRSLLSSEGWWGVLDGRSYKGTGIFWVYPGEHNNNLQKNYPRLLHFIAEQIHGVLRIRI